jgi:hypothetical protein
MNKYKILLLIAAIIQISSNFFTDFSGGSNFSELLITPAGYTFIIWALIISLCLVHAIYHAFFDKKVYSSRFYLSLSATYIMFTVWLLAAESNLILATVIINFAMFFLLQPAFREVLHKADLKNVWNKYFLQGGVGTYLGWLTIASIANVGVLLAEYGLQNTTSTGQIIQGVLVLAAVANAILMLKKFDRNIVLFATFWWGFVGILVGLYGRVGTDWLLAETVLLVLVLNLFYFRYLKL